MKEKFIKSIENILKENEKESLQLKKMRDGIVEGISLDRLRNLTLDAQVLNNKKHRAYRNLLTYLPEPDRYRQFFAEPTLKIEECECGYRIILDDLLPRKPKYNTKEQEMVHLQDRDLLYAGYRSGVEEYLKEHRIKRFDKKTCAIFINYFNPNDQMCDHDNIDKKIFVDAVIKNYFIEDDSPKHISYFMDFRHGEYTHTEVYIGFFEDLVQIKPLSIVVDE